ncbi:hypothetical protein QJS10_CPA05g01668 [Acorus calamus]|uniref:DUF4283 domain-containing protein n=1 Tax=Acorus calamus TaxID=4465 RepID=A0AAV9EV45_ACOCL|nr:hypothetical protein QJS10_CPA05g01668 [Acorus calamus]
MAPPNKDLRSPLEESSSPPPLPPPPPSSSSFFPNAASGRANPSKPGIQDPSLLDRGKELVSSEVSNVPNLSNNVGLTGKPTYVDAVKRMENSGLVFNVPIEVLRTLKKPTDEQDMMAVLSGGPWVILDHLLSLQRWKDDFDPETATFEVTPVWIRFPNLPLEYWDGLTLSELAFYAGTPIRVETTVEEVGRCRYARALVEVDLRQPLCPGVRMGVNGRWQRFVYEKFLRWEWRISPLVTYLRNNQWVQLNRMIPRGWRGGPVAGGPTSSPFKAYERKTSPASSKTSIVSRPSALKEGGTSQAKSIVSPVNAPLASMTGAEVQGKDIQEQVIQQSRSRGTRVRSSPIVIPVGFVSEMQTESLPSKVATEPMSTDSSKALVLVESAISRLQRREILKKLGIASVFQEQVTLEVL